MAQSTLTIKVKVAWWVIPYLKAVATFAALTGMQPDVNKVASTAMRGIKVVR